MIKLQNKIFEEIKLQAIPEKAELLSRYFKTLPGGYAEGDKFLGVMVPGVRKIAELYFRDVDYKTIEDLLNSQYHEVRLTALIMLTRKYAMFKDQKHEVFNFYMSHLESVNNWDLVDLSAGKIVGDWLLDKDRKCLFVLIESGSLWKQRVAVISTIAFIRKSDFADTFRMCTLLLNHPHDLMHKACGWMLREIYKRDVDAFYEYFIPVYHKMPRTMLRYAIEKVPELDRKKILSGEF